MIEVLKASVLATAAAKGDAAQLVARDKRHGTDAGPPSRHVRVPLGFRRFRHIDPTQISCETRDLRSALNGYSAER
jgi:hypothetical protein